MSGKHSEQTENHIPYAGIYADEATMLADTFTADDDNKLYLTSDTGTSWRLDDYSGPTFVELGGAGATAPMTLTLEDAVNNDVSDVITVEHNTTGSPAAGLGAAIAFGAESSTTEGRLMGVLKFLWRIVTDATRNADVVITTVQDGTERIRAVLAGNATGATSYDGNARGEMANDLQGTRYAATEVAAGDYSTICGGSGNTADGYGAVVSGGDSNSAGGDYASVPGGSNNNASGDWSQATGYSANADKTAQQAHSSGGLLANDAQTSVFHVRRTITHSTSGWTELQIGPNGVESRMTIPANSAWAFEALVVGATSGMGKSFAFHIRGLIENDGGTTTIKGTPVVTVIDDADDTSFDARATADDTNDALLIEVSDSDAAGDTVRWSARVQTAEIIYN